MDPPKLFCLSLPGSTAKSIDSLQKKYTIGSFELLSKTTPIQAISLLILGPFVDYYISNNNILNYIFSYGVILFLLFSCFFSSLHQQKSVHLHRALLSGFLPGPRSHENIELEKQAKIAFDDIENGLADDDVRPLKEGVEHNPL
ncbi:hypothetical protein POM88_038246 [Heracleum sosnowskyi]|uniref:Uncharacterized protein n=1 Tax=Heracleum sosnowskyi TaxID=360622 RepID=A0AAD8MGN3_9APIA|nr:hypothetical protein POM88_038246 [Heracleum sosnowskyi]